MAFADGVKMSALSKPHFKSSHLPTDPFGATEGAVGAEQRRRVFSEAPAVGSESFDVGLTVSVVIAHL